MSKQFQIGDVISYQIDPTDRQINIVGVIINDHLFLWQGELQIDCITHIDEYNHQFYDLLGVKYLEKIGRIA